MFHSHDHCFFYYDKWSKFAVTFLHSVTFLLIAISILITFKNTPKAFGKFENKQKSVWSNVFWYVKVFIFWNFIQHTIHWNKIQMLKKFTSDKINVKKNPLFFFRELQLITPLLLIRDSYMSWSTRFVSIKALVGFSIFDPVLNDICMSWNSPKTDMETNFLDLDNRSFENINFSQ